MAKKDLEAVQANLSSLADNFPSQHVPPKEAPPKKEARRVKKKVVAQPAEQTIQFSFGLRKSLRKELVNFANDADMTMRAFVLDALKAKGLNVTDADLIDMRKQKG